MHKLGTIFLGLSLLTACAGNEANIEKASYLLGKGGKANAAKAGDILESMKLAADNGEITGLQALEVYRLYAGAKMGAAGFDSVSIVSSLIFSEGSDFLSAISGALADNLESDAAALLTAASDALDSSLSNSAYALATTPDRVKRGLQFQRALVDLLKSIRVLIQTSDFNDSDFNAETCKAALSNGDELNDGVAKMYDARDRLSDTDGVALSSSNGLVTSLTTVLGSIDPDGNKQILNVGDLQTLCEYLESQKGAQ